MVDGLYLCVTALYTDSFLKAPPCIATRKPFSMMADSALITSILVFRSGSPCVLVQCIAVSIEFLLAMF
jgi:hypothetical protein